MNSPSSNSAGSATLAPPPPVPEFYLVLPDGSCIPATRENCRIVMRQARSDARKQAKIKRHEKAVELQMALEDRAAARSVQEELAELHRSSLRWPARFKVRAEPQRPARRTSSVTKRALGSASTAAMRRAAIVRPASSWVIDARGMKGVIWQQSYLGRKSPGFHPGKARENWEYIVRDEAVLRDADGEPVIISNMGDDWVEIGAAWQAMEDASTRANAKIQILAIAPFDSDMSEAEMIAALRHFCRTVLDPLDLPYSAAVHAPPASGDQRNFHPHIAFSLRPMRRVEPYCWEVADEVCGELDGRDGVQMLRHLWAHSMSEAAEQVQSNRRYTGLGYGARGLDLETGEHLGEARAAIVARGGHVWAHERNRIKAARNAARRAIRDADRKIAALTKVRDAALARMAARSEGIAPARVMRAARPVEPATVLVAGGSVTPAQTLRVSTPVMPATVRRPAQPVEAATVRAVAPAPVPATVRAAATPTVAATVVHPAPVPTAAIIQEAARPVRSSEPLSRAPGARLANQLSVARTATPATLRRSAVGAEPATHPLEAAPVPTSARTMTAAPQVRPRTEHAVTPAAPSATPTTIATDLLDALARARKARLRRQRQRKAGAALRLDALPTLAATPTFETLPSLDQLAAAAVSRTRVTTDVPSDEDAARLARLKALDPYVADYGHENGKVETDYPVLKALGVGWDWLDAPGVQPALRAMRFDQQRVLGDLARAATARPLDFARHGSRFWPRDLAGDDLRRLGRWAHDPGFQQDVFAIEQAIQRAHAARDAEVRQARDACAAGAPAPATGRQRGGLGAGPSR